MTIEADAQKLVVGQYVVLYDLDTTALGGGVYHFTQAALESRVVRWRGNEYTPVDILASGFEINGQGTLPRPKLTIGNSTLALVSAVRTWDDLIGAVVTRWRTLRKYLDGEPGADPNSYFPADVYRIERKTEQTKQHIQWELSAMTDQEGRKLPGRQILRDTCTAVYRRWTGAAFTYEKATCPYAGTNYFDRDGNTATADKDYCGKRRTDCELRFPNLPLPTHAFPGVAKTRY